MGSQTIETVVVPNHGLSHNDQTDGRNIDSFTYDEIKRFDKWTAVQYSRALGLKETGMSVNEVALLYDLLEKKGACKIVELGRNYGTSTRLFVQHVVRHGGYFESWDLKHWGNLKDTFINQGFVVAADHAFDLKEDYELSANIKIRIADSMKTPILPDARWVDFLLIDTEHGIENALGEYMRWRLYLNAGCFVAFHDSTLRGPKRAIEIVKEVEADFDGRIHREYVNDQVDGFGIHVLEWKG